MKGLIDRLVDLALAAEGRKEHAKRLLDKARADAELYTGSRKIGVLARVHKHREAYNLAYEEEQTLRGILEALRITFGENSAMESASHVRAWLDGYLGVRDSEWWKARDQGGRRVRCTHGFKLTPDTASAPECEKCR